MVRLATMNLTIAVLLGSAGVSWSADSQKGWNAYRGGDYATALREWEPLAEQGDATAQFNLGWMYALGQGVIQDNVYAHMWWNIAASQGKENATKNKDILANKMTPADLSKAQELARECMKKNYKGC